MKYISHILLILLLSISNTNAQNLSIEEVNKTHKSIDTFSIDKAKIAVYSQFFQNFNGNLSKNGTITSSIDKEKSREFIKQNLDGYLLTKPVEHSFYFNIKHYNNFSIDYKVDSIGNILLNGYSTFNSIDNKYGITAYFENGILNGVFRKLWDGQIVEIKNFKNGVSHGWEYNYDMRGKLTTKKYYNNGNQIIDSTEVYKYYNINKSIYETPKSITKFKFDRKNLKTDTILETKNEVIISYPKSSFLYFPSKNKMYVNSGAFVIEYDVEIEVLNEFGINYNAFKINKRRTYSESLKFDMECYTDVNGKCLSGPGQNVLTILKQGEYDLLNSYKKGELKTFYIDNSERLHIKRNSDLISKFWDLFNETMKSINDLFGGDGFSFNTDLDSNMSFTIINDGVPLEFNSVNMNEFFNHRKDVGKYFLDWKKEIEREEIENILSNEELFKDFTDFIDKHSINIDIPQTQWDNYEVLLADANFKTSLYLYYDVSDNNKIRDYSKDLFNRKKVKYFMPKPDVPYYWSNIRTPTASGTRRIDYGSKEQGLLANRPEGNRLHMAVDYEMIEHEVIYAPISGEVIKIGYPENEYKDDKGEIIKVSDDKNIQTITILSNGEFPDKKPKVRLIYLDVNDNLKEGDKVVHGQIIGKGVDMRIRFKNTNKEFYRYNPKMKNHIHMEITLPDGTRTDKNQIFSIN